MDYLYVLGVKLHKIKKSDILKKIDKWMGGDKFHYITTVNPEFTLIAQKDNEFKEILNNSDLAVPDGIGLKFASWVFGKNIYRTTGADLTMDILKLAEQKNCSLYFFVWEKGLSSVEEIKTAFIAGDSLSRSLRIEGQAIKKDGSNIDWKKINNFKSDILLVGLGAPFQEKLIDRISRKGEGTYKIKIAMGVGASFDFLCGKAKRAPKIMCFFGLEWLYRVCQPPKPPYKYYYRLKRIFNAVIVFSWKVVQWKNKVLFIYRRGATAVIVNNENKILLCQRSDDLNHWQFPKGGLEKGEIAEDAVSREIFEEVGLKNIKIIKKLTKKYKYAYNEPRHWGDLIKLKYGFKGQISDIFIIRFLGGEEIKIDNKEFVDYRWVESDELLNNLHPVRKNVGEMVLREFEYLKF